MPAKGENMFNTLKNLFFGSNLNTATKSYNHHINADIGATMMGDSKASTSKEVKEVIKLISRAGFKEVQTHGFGTNVSGDLQTLLKTIENIAKEIMENSTIPRLSLNLKISFRKDKQDQSISKRLAAVK